EEERDAYEIEHADQDPRAAAVLGDPMPARQQLDVDLGCGVPPRVREHDEEAVPVMAEPHLLEDLAAERLHRVRVAHQDVEDRAAEAVVDAGDSRLLVAADFAATHDVPPLR